MDFDQATLDKILASTEEHSKRLAEISATATRQAQAMRYAVSSGNYEKAWDLMLNHSVHDDDDKPELDTEPLANSDDAAGDANESVA